MLLLEDKPQISRGISENNSPPPEVAAGAFSQSPKLKIIEPENLSRRDNDQCPKKIVSKFSCKTKKHNPPVTKDTNPFESMLSHDLADDQTALSPNPRIPRHLMTSP